MVRKANRQGTAGRSTRAGQQVGWPVLMDIDLTQFIQTMRFISAVNQEIVVKKETRDKIAQGLIGTQMRDFYARAADQAVSSKRSIAHVYAWEDITEGGGYFKVTPDTSSPLFKIIRNNRRAGAVYSIKLLDNQQKALRDKRMEALAKGKLADHRFKDQATELERIAIIEKESSKISKRRISGTGQSGKLNLNTKRIIDLDPSGSKIINRKSVRRPNEFKNNFTEFFFEFFTFDGPDPEGFFKGGSVLARNLGNIQRKQRAFAGQARGGSVFSSGRRAGGATKITARMTASPVIAVNEKGSPIAVSGISLQPTSSDLNQVKRAVQKTYRGATVTGAVR